MPLRSFVPYRWELLAWLWLAYFLNQAELGLSDVQAGLVATLFIIAFGLVVPVAGYAGDVLPRKWIVVGSLALRSMAAVLTGFGIGLVSLILARSLATGVGEAFYAPSAHALIGEHHNETRAQALSLHQSAPYFGVVVSGLAAGYVGQRYGWCADSPVAVYIALGCFGVFRGIYDSNMFASVFEVIEPRLHASGAAVFICFGFTMGALSPLVLGAARQSIGLAGGLSALSLAYVAAGAALLAAAWKFFPRRRARNPEVAVRTVR